MYLVAVSGSVEQLGPLLCGDTRLTAPKAIEQPDREWKVVGYADAALLAELDKLQLPVVILRDEAAVESQFAAARASIGDESTPDREATFLQPVASVLAEPLVAARERLNAFAAEALVSDDAFAERLGLSGKVGLADSRQSVIAAIDTFCAAVEDVLEEPQRLHRARCDRATIAGYGRTCVGLTSGAQRCCLSGGECYSPN